MIFRILDLVRFSVSCFQGTTGLGCCTPPRFLVMLATGWERTLICWYGLEPWRVVNHVNDWCFRDIYNGGLWEDDLYVCALKRASPVLVTPMEHYLDDFCPVLHSLQRIFRYQGVM